MACTIDFRRLDEGFGGKTEKRKRSEQLEQILHPKSNDNAASMDVDDAPSAKRHAIASSTDSNRPAPFGCPTYDGVIAEKVSGRNWKQPRTRASAKVMSVKRSTFEERKRDREIRKAYKERKDELKEEIRKNKNEKRKKREEREKKKKENVLRSGTRLQKITNPKTLKKLAKSKQRKLLKVVPDDMVKK